MEQYTPKMKIAILILIALMLVSGCSIGGGSGSGNGVININYAAVHSGTDGIKVSFMNNAPQDKIYANEDFKIGLEIANKGAKNAPVCVNLGVEKDYISMVDSMPVMIENVDGKSVYNLKGSSNYKFFDAKTNEPVGLKSNHKSAISAEFFYEYETTAEMEVCLDPDIYGKVAKKPCAIKDISLSSQGAPVAIKSVKVSMLPIRGDNVIPNFIIQVQNVGTGKVIMAGESENACRGIFTPDEDLFDLVSVEATLSNKNLGCRNIVRLKNGAGEVVCNGPSVNYNDGTYPAPLVITLKYGYYSSETKNVEIFRKEIYNT